MKPESLEVVRSESEQVMALIHRGASDASVDVEKMERLFALLKDVRAFEAEQKFNMAMVQVQGELPPIVKDATNPSTNSKFARLDRIQEIVTPITLKHGFSLSFGTDKSELADHYGVTCLVSNGGHTRLYRCDVPIDNMGPKGLPNKTKTHGFGSALSYGERYLIKLIFNIRLVGEDDDGNQGNRPKSKGPIDDQVKQTDAEKSKTERLAVSGELWRVMESVRGDDNNWQKAQAWLWAEELLDAAANERISTLSIEKLRALIPKVKEKLK